jgi:membrane associated rhomboid family serine protease
MGKRGGGSPPGGNMQFSMMVQMTPVVRAIIITCASIWLIFQLILGKLVFGDSELLIQLFGLVPSNVVHHFFLWEVFTYMFLHALNPFHILFNMLLLWWLGSELESRWGSKFFLAYFLITGIGAALFYLLGVAIYAAFHEGAAPVWSTPVVGASGAIFGLMLAYGMIFGERVVYFMMVFPMRAKYFIMILGGVEVVTMLNNGFGSDVANLAHLGGLVSGFLFFQGYTRFQQRKWRTKTNRRGRGLKLVVNNETNEKGDKGSGGNPDKNGGGGPKYWN